MTQPKCDKCKVVSIDEGYRKYGKACSKMLEADGYKAMVNYAGYIKPCAEHKQVAA